MDVAIDKNTKWGCVGCGECCKGIIMDEEKDLSVEKDGERVCKYLSDNMCANYGERPFICKLYPFVMDLDSINEEGVAKPWKALELENLKIDTSCKGYGKGKRIYGNNRLKRQLGRLGEEFGNSFKKAFDENASEKVM